jgi:hypothetical protein
LLYSIPSEPVELYARTGSDAATEVSARYPDVVDALITHFEEELRAAGTPDDVLSLRIRERT